MKILTVLLLTLGIILSTSCEKQDLPDAPGKRLKMMKFTAGDSVFFTNYKYDSKNRLIAEQDSNINGVTFTKFFEYDDQNRLIESSDIHTDSFGNISKAKIRTFSYDANGKIIRSQYFYPPNTVAPIYNDSFIYDTKGRLTGVNHSIDYFPELSTYEKFYYDDKDNLIEWEYYRNDSTVSTKETMKHGTALNYLAQFNQYYFFATSERTALSRNNITELSTSIDLVNTINYEYEYFSSGIPKNIKIRYNQSPGYWIMELFYE